LHVQGNHSFSQEVNDFIGRPVQLKEGSYKIIYHPHYEFGIAIVRTY